jgi:hypothetical protein
VRGPLGRPLLLGRNQKGRGEEGEMVGTVARPVLAGADRLGRPGGHGRIEGQVQLILFSIIVSCKEIAQFLIYYW